MWTGIPTKYPSGIEGGIPVGSQSGSQFYFHWGFPCSDFVSQMWGWFGGGGGVMFFSHLMLFPTFLEKKSGNTKQLFLI